MCVLTRVGSLRFVTISGFSVPCGVEYIIGYSQNSLGTETRGLVTASGVRLTG